MARLAILLCDADPGGEQTLLARTLDFFGVPWKFVSGSSFSEIYEKGEDQAVFGSATSIAAVIQQEGMIARCLERSTVFYAYSDRNRLAAQRGITQLLENSRAALRDASEETVSVEVSSHSEIKTGPMAGIRTNLRMRKEDAILAGLEELETRIDPIISADGAPIYLEFRRSGIPIFLCASSYAIDIDQEIETGYYDIKEHFCSAVPLLLFIRLMFEEVAWHPQELGACFIIDDPLLQKRYGCCDFEQMRRLMHDLEFSTNIAFIPWNWWRTSRAAGDLFDKGSGPFSVSIHGCDHVKAEFGTQSQNIMYGRARLAQTRMQKHENRTGIHHEKIMVFPQGVFSSECPEVLKRTEYMAAVNTEISPVVGTERSTRIRDVWDVAIMKYGDFAIFTRRYAHHGIENFAFDLLLGKPCLIVAHHEFFRDGNASMIRLLEGLQARNCSLKWQTLGAVIRKACRRRSMGLGMEEVQMYGTELVLLNSREHALQVLIRKNESDTSAVREVQCDGASIQWHPAHGELTFDRTVAPKSESSFRISYREPDQMIDSTMTGTARSAAAARRLFSEVRDASVGHLASLNRVAKKLSWAGLKTNRQATS